MSAQDDFVLEGRPTAAQRQRVEAFLAELAALSTRYGLIIDCWQQVERSVLIDAERGTVVGTEPLYFVDARNRRRVASYELADSILDGVWLVDSEDGPVEQMLLHGRAPERPSRDGIPPWLQTDAEGPSAQ